MQNHYNLVYREEEREMFPTLKVSFRIHQSCFPSVLFTHILLQHFGVGAIPYSSLARGYVTRPLGETNNRNKVGYVGFSLFYVLLSITQSFGSRVQNDYDKTEGNKEIVRRYVNTQVLYALFELSTLLGRSCVSLTKSILELKN